MNLTKLSVTDYKRVRGASVEFDPEQSGVVLVGGRNEQGKSSFLDALEVAIAGPRKGPNAARPVRTGAEQARIIAEFREDDGSVLVVTRKFAPDGSTTIEVRVDGVKISRTGSVLDRLWSHVAFDPFAWGSLPSREQVDTLVRVSGVDPKPYDDDYDARYIERQDVNREVNRLAAVLGQTSDDPAALELGMQDSAKLVAELDELRGRNTERQAVAADILRLTNDVATYERQIDELTRRRDQASANLQTAQAQAVQIGELEAEDDLRERIGSVSETNARVQAQQNRVDTQQRHDELAARARELTARLQQIAAEKRQAFADADMPVPGLTIEDGEVYLDGTPFSQTSPGGKLKTGTAIAIALNPTLRAIIIRDGSLLDRTNRQIVDDIAREHGFLVLMEVVDEASSSGIVFEDGALLEA